MPGKSYGPYDDSEPGGGSGQEVRTGWAKLRFVLGSMLIVAAALKGHELATEPVSGTSLFNSRGFQITLVEGELLLGLWLISGVFAPWSWTMALAVFLVFASVSAMKILAGDTSCGCFGKVPLSPWWSLGIDLAACAALLRWRPTEALDRGIAARPHRLLLSIGLFVGLGLPAALLMATYKPTTLDAAGDVLGDGEIVLLEPEKWLGKSFPLFGYVDCERALRTGKWIAVLYHHDCPKCQEVIPGYEVAAMRLAVADDPVQIVLLEMPPYGHYPRPQPSHCHWCRISDSQEWFVTAPVELVVEDGMVTKVSTELDELRSREATAHSRAPWTIGDSAWERSLQLSLR